MMVPGLSAGDRWSNRQPPAFQDSLDTSQILRRRFDLPPAPHQDDHFGAGVSAEVDMRGRPNMVSPPVLGGGQTKKDVRCRGSIEERDDAQGV